jgi:hypothetical protein
MRSKTSTACGIAALFAILALISSGAVYAQDNGDKNADAAGKDDGKAGDGKDGDGKAGEAKAGEGDGKGDSQVAADAPPAAPEVPVNLRLRSLEQRVQALKERAWRAKARVGMLKEAVLGGGVGARASIVHRNKMGSKFRLIRLVYALDGSQIFTRSDDSGKLHDTERFEVLTGPISPGSHTLSVVAIYRGHGYGVFRYLNKYKFTVKSSHTFTADEGKGTSIVVKGFEKGGATTPMEKRPAIDFKVSVIQGGKK